MEWTTLFEIFAVVAVFAVIGRPLFVLSANRELARYADQRTRTFPIGAAWHLYKGANVGRDPAGYAKPFVPGDIWIGFAQEEVDNSSGAAGAKYIDVEMTGDWRLPIANIAVSDAGKPVYATADDAWALTGHPDAYVGNVIAFDSAGYAVVRQRVRGQAPINGEGSVRLKLHGSESFEATGAASTSKYHPAGFECKSILGLGVLAQDAADGGVKLQFDAVAEVALASVRTINDTFPVSKGVTLRGKIVVADKGDNAALDIDIGLGTALTANSEADVLGHADMVNVACFHLDGNSDNILAASDDNVNPIAAVDTTIDNDSATDVPKELLIIVRPTGAVEMWIEKARVLSNTAFAVSAAANLAAFVNMEKTNDDTTAVVIISDLEVAGGKA